MDQGTVLVVGATGGVGEPVVRGLLAAGFRTVFTGRKQDALDRTAGSLGAGIPRLLDALDPDAVRRLVGEIDSQYGLSAYVHLAGGFAMGPRIDRLTDADWQRMFDRNWVSLRNGASIAFEALARRGSGSIVTVGSLAALSGGAKMAPYAVAKAAVICFTHCLAMEGRGAGVRANCIVPGTLDTQGNREAMPDADRSGWIPGDQLASTIAFLCSPASTGVNGTTIMMRGSA